MLTFLSRKVSDSVERSDAEAKNALDVVKRNAADGSKPAVVHLLAIIPEHEDAARRHFYGRKIPNLVNGITAFVERNAVDEHMPRNDFDRLAGHADDALDEKPVSGGKQHDIPALRHAHKLANAVAEHHFSALELGRHALVDDTQRSKPNKKHKAKNGYRDQHGKEPSNSSCVSIRPRAAFGAAVLSLLAHG